DRLLDHDRLGDKVRVHIRPVAPVVNGRANSPGPDAANGKPRHERSAVVPPVVVVLAVPVAVDPALVIRPTGPVCPARVAVGPARPVHVHIVDVVVDIINRAIVPGVDGTAGPIDSDIDAIVGPVDDVVSRVIADAGPVDDVVSRVIADAWAVDDVVSRVIADAGPVAQVRRVAAAIAADAGPVAQVWRIAATSADAWPIAQVWRIAATSADAWPIAT